MESVEVESVEVESVEVESVEVNKWEVRWMLSWSGGCFRTFMGLICNNS